MPAIMIDHENLTLAYENSLDLPVNLLRTPYMDVSVEQGQVKVDIK